MLCTVLVAGACSRISKRLTRLRNKLPVVALGMQRQLQDAISIVIARLAVRLGRAKHPVRILPPAAHNKFPNAAVLVELPVRILRRETLVVVIVSVDDHVRPGFVERVPKRLHHGIVPVLPARAEQRLMPVSQRALRRRRSQILLQPLSLRRAGIAPAHLIAFAVDDNDVPRPKIVAVVALLRIARRLAKIARVPGCPIAVIFVIPNRRPGAILKSAPGRPIAIGELVVGTVRIREVTHGKYHSRNLVDELRRSLSPFQLPARRNISGAYENGVRSGGRRSLLRFFLRHAGRWKTRDETSNTNGNNQTS